MDTLDNDLTVERHRARAMRLLDLMEECHRLDEECLVAIDPEVSPDPPEDVAPDVPYRYAGVQYSGSATWLIFGNDLTQLRRDLEDEAVDETPWAPGDVVDLDTGQRWGSFVKVTLKPYTHRVSWIYVVFDDTRHKSSTRVHGLEEAEAMKQRLADSGGAQDISIEEIPHADEIT